MTNRAAEVSPLIYTRVAGILYILIILIGVFNGIFIDSKIIIIGNDAATANNIIANELLFRSGIASILILYAGVVVLSWALYVILKKENKDLALLAMLLRFGEAILGSATVLISFIVLGLLNANGYSTGIDTEQFQALVGLLLGVRTAALDIVLIFVGLGGTVFCYLFFMSKYVPRILATWGIFTYLSMLVLSFISILLPNHPEMLEIILYALGGLFELIFGFWLLIKGVSVNDQ